MRKVSEDNNVEFKGVEIHDLLGLSQPLTKLVETVSKGIGTLYEPINSKRMAKAKTFEIQLISSTINSNLQLPMKYENGNVTRDSTDANELVQRAQSRFLFQEMRKQQNIESVINKTASELSAVTSVSDIPVDEDWISEFFNCVANVSNPQMQILWGKILAGEVENPGQFSRRTLDTLKKLTQKEAELFKNISKFVLSGPLEFEYDAETNDYFVPSHRSITQKYNITFPDIVILSDAGLLSYDNSISAGPNVPIHGTGYLYYRGYPAIEFVNHKEEPVILYRSVYLLTSVGKELLSVTANNTTPLHNLKEYLEDCKKIYCTDEVFGIDEFEKPSEDIQARVVFNQ